MKREYLDRLVVETREHADNLQADIANSTTRIEHMRLTRLAVEARRIAVVLQTIADQPALQVESEDEI